MEVEPEEEDVDRQEADGKQDHKRLCSTTSEARVNAQHPDIGEYK